MLQLNRTARTETMRQDGNTGTTLQDEHKAALGVSRQGDNTEGNNHHCYCFSLLPLRVSAP